MKRITAILLVATAVMGTSYIGAPASDVATSNITAAPSQKVRFQLVALESPSGKMDSILDAAVRDISEVTGKPSDYGNESQLKDAIIQQIKAYGMALISNGVLKPDEAKVFMTLAWQRLSFAYAIKTSAIVD